ncbi:superoxide dismutase [Stenotrophomonas sp. NLF4-10]|jgi:Fe-Mn family superoxide dismutase|uniref:superoxide dismutase n=1 Tax=Stenotrophomonas sp. NLF4-10 TaxID=2918754 RepID=UPI001EFA3DDD|nr:superoxide dismutase [Stenotrophomonas sp. NLF4-10]MCG8276156.1 superoxide dismutase [Stenotrophomonas sp. NLF4-10]
MPVELPDLPYPRTALQPHLSAETLDLHHGGHHRAYVDALNARIAGTELDGLPLEDIVRGSQGSLFEVAAQAWNHAFFWQCLHPRAGGEPHGALAERITRQFGDVQKLREEFNRAALAVFGSGWCWLVQHPDGRLAIATTRNANTPLTGDSTPLLACDLWEHAYYTDYQNDRARYLQAFWKLVNWDFVGAQLQ